MSNKAERRPAPRLCVSPTPRSGPLVQVSGHSLVGGRGPVEQRAGRVTTLLDGGASAALTSSCRAGSHTFPADGTGRSTRVRVAFMSHEGFLNFLHLTCVHHPETTK